MAEDVNPVVEEVDEQEGDQETEGSGDENNKGN